MPYEAEEGLVVGDGDNSYSSGSSMYLCGSTSPTGETCTYRQERRHHHVRAHAHGDGNTLTHVWPITEDDPVRSRVQADPPNFAPAV